MTRDFQDIRSIKQRLLKLERQNRIMKLAGMTLLLILVSILLMGQVHSGRTAELERIVLTDAGGKIYADLGLFSGTTDTRGTYQPLLRFIGEDGRNTVTLLPGSLIIRNSIASTVIEAGSIYVRDQEGKVVWKAPDQGN